MAKKYGVTDTRLANKLTAIQNKMKNKAKKLASKVKGKNKDSKAVKNEKALIDKTKKRAKQIGQIISSSASMKQREKDLHFVLAQVVDYAQSNAPFADREHRLRPSIQYQVDPHKVRLLGYVYADADDYYRPGRQYAAFVEYHESGNYWVLREAVEYYRDEISQILMKQAHDYIATYNHVYKDRQTGGYVKYLINTTNAGKAIKA